MTSPLTTADLGSANRPVGSSVNSNASEDIDEGTLAELTESLAQLRAFTESRLAQAKDFTDDVISSRPITSVAACAVAGLVLALLITPRSQERRVPRYSHYMPDAFRFEPQLPASLRMMELPSRRSLIERAEATLEAMKRIGQDVQTSPAFDQAREWLASFIAPLSRK